MLADENLLNAWCLEELQEEVTQKLQELSDIVQNGEHLTSELEQKFPDSTEVSGKSERNENVIL